MTSQYSLPADAVMMAQKYIAVLLPSGDQLELLLAQFLEEVAKISGLLAIGLSTLYRDSALLIVGFLDKSDFVLERSPSTTRSANYELAKAFRRLDGNADTRTVDTFLYFSYIRADEESVMRVMDSFPFEGSRDPFLGPLPKQSMHSIARITPAST